MLLRFLRKWCMCHKELFHWSISMRGNYRYQRPAFFETQVVVKYSRASHNPMGLLTFDFSCHFWHYKIEHFKYFEKNCQKCSQTDVKGTFTFYFWYYRKRSQLISYVEHWRKTMLFHRYLCSLLREEPGQFFVRFRS